MIRHHAESIERLLLDMPTEWFPTALLVIVNAVCCTLHVTAHVVERTAR